MARSLTIPPSADTDEPVSHLKAYLGLSNARLDPYHLGIGALVLRSTLPAFQGNAKARMFEPILAAAIGEDGKDSDATRSNRVKDASNWAREAMVRHKENRLPPELAIVLDSLGGFPPDLGRRVFLALCSTVDKAIRLVTARTGKVFENTLKTSLEAIRADHVKFFLALFYFCLCTLLSALLIAT